MEQIENENFVGICNFVSSMAEGVWVIVRKKYFTAHYHEKWVIETAVSSKKEMELL